MFVWKPIVKEIPKNIVLFFEIEVNPSVDFVIGRFIGLMVLDMIDYKSIIDVSIKSVKKSGTFDDGEIIHLPVPDLMS